MSSKWDCYWLSVAAVTAKMAKCHKRKVGAIVVDNNRRAVATGYNGAPAGFPDANSIDCRDFCQAAAEGTAAETSGYANCVAVHAELNALLHSNRSDLAHSTLYVTCTPCLWCAKAIANSQVSRVVWLASDKDSTAVVEFLTKCGLTVCELQEKSL